MQAPGTKATNHKHRVGQFRRTLLGSVLLATTTVGRECCDPVSTLPLDRPPRLNRTTACQLPQHATIVAKDMSWKKQVLLRYSIAAGDEKYPEANGPREEGDAQRTSRPTPHNHLRLGIAKQCFRQHSRLPSASAGYEISYDGVGRTRGNRPARHSCVRVKWRIYGPLSVLPQPRKHRSHRLPHGTLSVGTSGGVV